MSLAGTKEPVEEVPPLSVRHSVYSIEAVPDNRDEDEDEGGEETNRRGSIVSETHLVRLTSLSCSPSEA